MMFNQYKEYKKLFEILKEKSDAVTKSGIIDPTNQGRVNTQHSKLSLKSDEGALTRKESKAKVNSLEIKKLDYTANKLKRYT